MTRHTMPSDLRDLVASALRGDGEWDSLSESQKAVWRADADRAIKALQSAPGYAQGLKAVLSFLDELADNASPGKRKALNPIVIGGSAKLYAEGLRAALPAPAGVEATVEEIARKFRLSMLDNPSFGTFPEREQLRTRLAIEHANSLLADFTIIAKPAQEGGS